MKRFSLRFLLLLVLLTGVLCGVVASRYHARLRERAIALQIEHWAERCDAMAEQEPVTDQVRVILQIRTSFGCYATSDEMAIHNVVHPRSLESVGRLRESDFRFDRFGHSPQYCPCRWNSFESGSPTLSLIDFWGRRPQVRRVYLVCGWKEPAELDVLRELTGLQLLAMDSYDQASVLRAVRAAQPPFFALVAASPRLPKLAAGDKLCEALGENPNLRGVSLDSVTSISSRGALGLARARTLEAVMLQGSSMHDPHEILTWHEPLQLGDDGLAALVALPRIQWLAIRHACCGASGLSAGIGPRLQCLFLEHCPLTDEAAERLAGCTQLHHLSLAGTEVSDDGARRLAGLPNLRTLDLSHTRVTSKFVRELTDLTTFPALEKISLCYTSFTEDDMAVVKAVRPNLIFNGLCRPPDGGGSRDRFPPRTRPQRTK